MPIHINEQIDGNFLTVHVDGILSQADYGRFVPQFEQIVQQHGKLRVLFDMTGFHGWEAAAIWEEIKFDANDYPAEQAGVVSIRVRDPNESKRVIEAVLACLGGLQPTMPREEKSR